MITLVAPTLHTIILLTQIAMNACRTLTKLKVGSIVVFEIGRRRKSNLTRSFVLTLQITRWNFLFSILTMDSRKTVPTSTGHFPIAGVDRTDSIIDAKHVVVVAVCLLFVFAIFSNVVLCDSSIVENSTAAIAVILIVSKIIFLSWNTSPPVITNMIVIAISARFIHYRTSHASKSLGTVAMVICDVLDRVNLEIVSLGVFGMTHKKGVSWYAFGAIHAYQGTIFIAILA
jgi:hypothetical protein